tara:strand:+ start:564 stop:1208 length:645 start_codon:yes stop_codon:yes gene_type:complete
MDIGAILLNLGFTLNFIALAFREILWIRVLLTVGYLLRFITQYIFVGNMNTSVWMIIFVAINLFQIIQIINERRKRYIEPKIFDIYESVFNSLTTYEFLTFWKIGKIKNVKKDTKIIVQGKKLNSILLLLSGKVKVQNAKVYITYLPRGSFMGEMSFISKSEASADVISEEDVSYIEWTNQELSKIKGNNKIFWTKIQNILLNDLVNKIKRSNS